jgi:hypothetical protein
MLGSTKRVAQSVIGHGSRMLEREAASASPSAKDESSWGSSRRPVTSRRMLPPDRIPMGLTQDEIALGDVGVSRLTRG